MEGWKGVLDNGTTVFYLIKMRLSSNVYEPVGSPCMSVNDAIYELGRLREIIPPELPLEIWKMEQSVQVSRCGVVRFP